MCQEELPINFKMPTITNHCTLKSEVRYPTVNVILLGGSPATRLSLTCGCMWVGSLPWGMGWEAAGHSGHGFELASHPLCFNQRAIRVTNGPAHCFGGNWRARSRELVSEDFMRARSECPAPPHHTPPCPITPSATLCHAAQHQLGGEGVL